MTRRGCEDRDLTRIDPVEINYSRLVARDGRWLTGLVVSFLLVPALSCAVLAAAAGCYCCRSGPRSSRFPAAE